MTSKFNFAGILDASTALWAISIAAVLRNETTMGPSPTFYYYTGTIPLILSAIAISMLAISALCFRGKRFALPVGTGLSFIILLIAVFALSGPPGDPFSDIVGAVVFPAVMIALSLLAIVVNAIASVVKGRDLAT